MGSTFPFRKIPKNDQDFIAASISIIISEVVSDLFSNKNLPGAVYQVCSFDLWNFWILAEVISSKIRK